MQSPRIMYVFVGLCSLSTAHELSAQSVMNISVVTVLPPAINESSGLQRTGANCFWSHNDSGGQPELYNFDTTGTLVRTLLVSNATNIDWEELTTDTAGNLYIGDFGNNNCDRQDLVIYKINNPDIVPGNSITAEAIYYSYPDQYAFPPHPSKRNFDMESMIAINDSLYLFTKNQTSPSNGYTKVYRLPLDSGTYVAQLVDSFLIGAGSTDGYSITGARITADYDTLLLISHERMWIFSGFTGTHFFSGTSTEFLFSGVSSNKEGVVFGSGSNVYISDEFTVAGTQNLYYMDLLNPALGNQPIKQELNDCLSVFPNPFSEHTVLQTDYPINNATLTAENCFGQTVTQLKNINGQTITLPRDNLASGVYIVRLTQDDQVIATKRIIITD
jgi:hypothetical protein